MQINVCPVSSGSNMDHMSEAANHQRLSCNWKIFQHARTLLFHQNISAEIQEDTKTQT